MRSYGERHRKVIWGKTVFLTSDIFDLSNNNNNKKKTGLCYQCILCLKQAPVCQPYMKHVIWGGPGVFISHWKQWGARLFNPSLNRATVEGPGCSCSEFWIRNLSALIGRDCEGMCIWSCGKKNPNHCALWLAFAQHWRKFNLQSWCVPRIFTRQETASELGSCEQIVKKTDGITDWPTGKIR